MAHLRVSMAATRSVLSHNPLQQFQRCFLSSRASQTKLVRRSAIAFNNSISARLPMTQKRTKYKTIQEAKSRYRIGPFSWPAGLIFLAACAGLSWYFSHEKERLERKRIAEANKGVGKPLVGGDFNLIDHDGNPFSSDMLKGRYSLVYFGFTRCPDICPDELDKMARILDLVKEKSPIGDLLPIFITCDPARDEPKALKGYLAEFHPDFVGLTGTYEEIKSTCKKYRVYFSTPENVKPGQDYLVDHSIYFYLMDPDGDFVECLGRQHSPADGAKLILDHMNDWVKKKK